MIWRSNRPAPAYVEIDPSGNRNGLSLQRGNLVQRDIRAGKIELSLLHHGPVQNISGHQALTTAHFSIGQPVLVVGQMQQTRQPVEVNSLRVHIIERKIRIEHRRKARSRSVKSPAQNTFNGIVQTEKLLHVARRGVRQLRIKRPLARR